MYILFSNKQLHNHQFNK